MITNNFMKLALEQAKIALAKNEVPVGAVIVENNKVLSLAHNSTSLTFDPTAHCEILSIRKACFDKQSFRLDNCDIYVTLEPCLMCFWAIRLARIKRIYYALADEKFGAISNNSIEKSSNYAYPKIEIYDGICESESKELLQNFFQSKRAKQHEKIYQKDL
jgi:tRNA(adenine34) deaminase